MSSYGSGFGFNIGGGGSTPASGSTGVLPAITQTLNAGGNVVNLGGSYDVIGVSVFEGNQLVQTDFSITNATTVNVELSAGSITDATINITYRVP